MGLATQDIDKLTFKKAAFILKAVAHPKRLAIIDYLHFKGKTSVNDIVETLQCEQSCISHHLIGMKLRGILDCEKNGQNVYYWLKMPDVICLLDCVEGIGKENTEGVTFKKNSKNSL